MEAIRPTTRLFVMKVCEALDATKKAVKEPQMLRVRHGEENH